MVEKRPFVDHYEVLQVSQAADGETIERVYRLLAKRYHPDNSGSGDVDQFTAVQRSYDVLSHPENSAQRTTSNTTRRRACSGRSSIKAQLRTTVITTSAFFTAFCHYSTWRAAATQIVAVWAPFIWSVCSALPESTWRFPCGT